MLSSHTLEPGNEAKEQVVLFLSLFMFYSLVSIHNHKSQRALKRERLSVVHVIVQQLST